MKKANSRCTYLLTVVLMTFVGLSSLNTLAAIEVRSVEIGDRAPGKMVTSALINQFPSGVVLIVRGTVTINDGSARTGQTILSNSTITTHSDSEAIIDLGSLGLIWIRESTSVVLTFTSAMIQLRSRCDATRIEVRQGRVEVKLLGKPKTEMLSAYNTKTYAGSVDVLARATSNFIVDCSGKRISIEAEGTSRKGLIALILIGVGASIIGGGTPPGDGGFALSPLLP